jgi:putative ABC transport system permease protein
MLAWCNLVGEKTRTVLSAFAVALGVAMTIAADVTSGAILNALSESEDAMTFMKGLLDQLDVLLMMVGVGITFAAGFMVFNAFAMSIAQRRQQIGALRSLGMTRRQTMRLVMLEALMTGVMGTVLGVVAGPLLGRGTITLMKVTLGEEVFIFSAGPASPASILLAVSAGIAVTLLSVLIPAWQTTRIPPLVAIREDFGTVKDPDRSRYTWIPGTLTITLLILFLVFFPPAEWVEPPWDVILTGVFMSLWLLCLASTVPSLVGSVGRRGLGLLTSLWGARGKLVSENLQRDRHRVTLTVLTLTVALTMMVGVTGFLRFMFNELMAPKMEATIAGNWMITTFDISAGMSGYSELKGLSLDALAEVKEAMDGQVQIMEVYFVAVPELSILGSSYFSMVMDPDKLRENGTAFTFTEGDWETAMPIMESGCGVLVSPLVASKNEAALGESFLVTGVGGSLECTVAGIGSPLVGASFINLAAGERIGVTEPLSALAWPLPGANLDTFETDLQAVAVGYPDIEVVKMETAFELPFQVMEQLPLMLNALLLLAILSAALGVVSTTMISVSERRLELGLLRAVGASRRQVRGVVVGEAGLIGLVGGALGTLAGAGVTVILVVTYGGNAWGIPGLDLWGSAWRSLSPALFNGLVGMITAPFICAGAAWLPVRSILSGPVIETMEPPR